MMCITSFTLIRTFRGLISKVVGVGYVPTSFLGGRLFV